MNTQPTTRLALALLLVATLLSQFCLAQPTSVVKQKTRLQLKSANAKATNVAKAIAPKAIAPKVIMQRMRLPGHRAARMIRYEVINGLKMFEGDIVLGKENEITVKSLQINGNELVWPNGIVPFKFHNSVSNSLRSRILAAVKHINDATKVTFTQNTAGLKDYVVFVQPSDKEMGAAAGSSPVGRQGGKQTIRLRGSASKGVIIHEMCHTLGIWHEQSRADRDNRVSIFWNNITDDNEHNFEKHLDDGMDYGPYDYKSIMHYGKTAFGKKAANGTKLKTIVPKPNPNVSIGQRTGLSKLDIDGINHLYAKAFLPGWAELARHAVPASKYQGEFSKITALGYRPVWIDGYDVNGKTYFNVVFRPANGKAWVARHGLSGSKYQTEFKKWTKLGYRLAHVESYKSGSNVRYAAIFVKTSGPAWTAYHGLTAAKHKQKFDSLTKKGYRPVNVSVVSIAGVRLHTALYEKRNVGGFFLKNFMTPAQYQTLFNQNAKAGRRLVYLNAYTHSGKPRIIAIWQQSAPSLVARHGLSSSQYQAEFNKNLKAGRLTRAVTGYESSDKHRFAAFWTQ